MYNFATRVEAYFNAKLTDEQKAKIYALTKDNTSEQDDNCLYYMRSICRQNPPFPDIFDGILLAAWEGSFKKSELAGKASNLQCLNEVYVYARDLYLAQLSKLRKRAIQAPSYPYYTDQFLNSFYFKVIGDCELVPSDALPDVKLLEFCCTLPLVAQANLLKLKENKSA